MGKQPEKEKQPAAGELPISKRSVVTAAKEQVSCDLAGEAVILNLESGVYFGLNKLGARVWSLIQEPTTVQKVHEVLLDEYDVEPERCERDLLALLQKLLEAGLLEVGTETKA